jgi:hypothetical protein
MASPVRIQRSELMIVGLALGALLASGILATPLFNLDEIWVYQLSRRIAHGYTPYRDFYLIVFPFAMQVNAAALALLSDQLLVLRGVAVVVSLGTAIAIYVACRKVGVSRALCLFPLAAFIWAEFISPPNSYTWFAFAFLAAALLTDITLLERARGAAGTRARVGGLAILTGCLLGLATLSKQHVGLAGLAASLMFTVAAGPKDYRARPDIGRAGLKLLGWLAVVAVELGYLWRSEALGPFLKYTIIEALTFRGEAGVPYSTLMRLPGSTFLAFLVPACLLFSLCWALWRWNRDPGHAVPFLLFSYGLASLSITYPRADLAHILVIAPLAVIGPSLWLSERMAALRWRWIELMVAFPLLVLFFAPLVRVEQHLAALRHGDVRLSSLPHYAGIPIDPGLDDMVSQVGDAMRRLEAEGRRVYFIEHSAALFLIPADRFADRFDVPMLGNFGARGMEQVIEQLAGDETAAVLLLPGSHELEPKPIVDFIQATMIRAGEVAGYQVYVHPERNPKP